DRQVKIRGYRIELGEVQAALAALDDVEQAVVIAREDQPGVKRLVGYLTGTADPGEARTALAERLPVYMVPAAVVALDALPLTPNGKLDVRALPAAEYTGSGYRAPATATERAVADSYAQVLGVERVGVDDSFFDLGGDSISAMRVVAAINASLGVDLAVRALFDAPTVRALSLRLRAESADGDDVDPVQILREGSGVPLFCIHPAGGVSWPYRVLGKYLDRPIFGIQQTQSADAAAPRSVRELAEIHADRIQDVYPDGPYHLLGWSFGGVVAHEIAIELQRRGRAIGRLILLDAQPSIDDAIALPEHALGEQQVLDDVLRAYNISVDAQTGPPTDEQLAELLRESGVADIPRHRRLVDLLAGNLNDNIELYRLHEPRLFDGDICVFSAVRDQSDRSSLLARSWEPYASGDVLTHAVDCTHNEMLSADSVARYGRQLWQLLREERRRELAPHERFNAAAGDDEPPTKS
ncbi:thioesterase domain-containing protein, partial [Mycobacterium sp. 1245499.0]|uniref:thioesterase domain-containing protein n=1 Tax=Mycobacterium sp. 1245499.0 TaxID=1834074 RepID=UPI000AD642DD